MKSYLLTAYRLLPTGSDTRQQVGQAACGSHWPFSTGDMMRSTAIFLLALALLTLPVAAGGLEVGKAGGEFTLANGDATVSLSGILELDDARMAVVYIASYTCPSSLRADQDLKPMLAPYSGQGVRFVGIYPNQQETGEGVAEYAGKQGFTHLMLRDPDAAVARSFGAEVTPTFFLFDKTGYLRYRGNLGGLATAMDAVRGGMRGGDRRGPGGGRERDR